MRPYETGVSGSVSEPETPECIEGVARSKRLHPGNGAEDRKADALAGSLARAARLAYRDRDSSRFDDSETSSPFLSV